MDDPRLSSHPFLAYLKTQKDRPTDKEIAQNPSLFSCLSSHVSRILLPALSPSSTSTSDTSRFIDEGGRLNWERLDRTELVKKDDFVALPENLVDHADGEWFIASMRVHQVALQSYELVKKSGIDWKRFVGSSAAPEEALRGPGLKHVYRIHEEYLRTENALLGLCGLTAIFERLLGDLFLSLENQNQPNAKLRRKPPPLIRDLLQTPEMKAVLGESPLFLLQVILGSPRALNLRNIAWHGFASPNEVHPGFYCLLLLLYLDVVEFRLLGVQDNFISRELRDLSSLPPSDFDFGLGPMSILSEFQADSRGSLTTSQEALKVELFEVFQKSLFVVPGRSTLFHQALEYYAKADTDPYAIFFCLILALPTLEHCLRAFWITENSMPTPLLCADSFRYYSIIDMFLDTHVNDDTMSVDALTTGSLDDTPPSSSNPPQLTPSPTPPSSTPTIPAFDAKVPVLPRFGSPTQTYQNAQLPAPQQRPNRLVEVLGTPLMTAMNDIFLFPLGPRPRDRISHGDVDPNKIGRLSAARCMEIIIALCLKFMPSEDTNELIHRHLFEPFESCKRYFESFVPSWHPKSLLQRHLAGPSKVSWIKWKAMVLAIPYRDAEVEEIENKAERRREFSDEISQAILLSSSLASRCLQLATSSGSTLLDFQIDIEQVYSPVGLQATEEKRLQIKDSFDYLNCPNATNSILEALRKLSIEVQSLIEMWMERFNDQKAQVEGQKASSRLAATFYKVLGVLNFASIFLSLLLQIIQLGLLSPTFSQKTVRRLSTGVAQLKQKILTNAWEDCVALMVTLIAGMETMLLETA